MAKSAKKRFSGGKASTSRTTHSKAVGRPEAKNVRADSKQARIIVMLQSPVGATIAAMVKATDWQSHSVRGFLAGVVRKRLKLKLGSAKIDGQRVYRIASDRASKPAHRLASNSSR